MIMFQVETHRTLTGLAVLMMTLSGCSKFKTASESSLRVETAAYQSSIANAQEKVDTIVAGADSSVPSSLQAAIQALQNLEQDLKGFSFSRETTKKPPR